MSHFYFIVAILLRSIFHLPLPSTIWESNAHFQSVGIIIHIPQKRDLQPAVMSIKKKKWNAATQFPFIDSKAV
jgi:hypothetical protein